ERSFLILSNVRRAAKKFKAGTYFLQRGLPQDSVLTLLIKGMVAVKKVTIPEGLNIFQTASILKRQLGIDSAGAIKLMLDTTFIRKLNLEQNSLEGYLFPETYFFPWSADVGYMLLKMANRAIKVYNSIFEENEITKIYNRHEIFILASIIEKETAVQHEMACIAGVFYNRLNRSKSKGGPMPLGADPTVRYALNKYSGTLTRSNLMADSPYNTRIKLGLPPGPICSPGKNSLLAALSPEKHGFFYFVARYDGSGEHYFSKTNSQHEEMKILAERNKLLLLKASVY
ncbi:MAG: endolytic transglycosylase MltG, partial [Elusimicrobiota bacterium]